MADEQEKQTRVLIVSLPGMMQHVIKEIFSGRTDVNLVDTAYGGLSAIRMVERHLPDLIVINSNLPEIETCELIQWLKKEQPQILSLALGETSRQISKAIFAGADFALRSNSLPDQLNRLMSNLSKNFGTNKD